MEIALRTVLTAVGRIMDRVAQSLRAGRLVLHTCAGTLVTARPFLQLLDSCMSVCFEKDFACPQKTLPSFMNIYSKCILSAESNIAGGSIDVEERRMYVNDLAALTSKGKFDCWTAPSGLFPVPTLPRHVMKILMILCTNVKIPSSNAIVHFTMVSLVVGKFLLHGFENVLYD